jgi:hypothetical protein
MISATGALLLCAAPTFGGEALNDMDEVGAAIMNCWKAPSSMEDSFVTLSFSFRRDGTLIGRPRATGSNVQGDAEARKKFIDSAITALEDCTPLAFSPSLADGIGGQVFTMRLSGSGAEAAEPRPTN